MKTYTKADVSEQQLEDLVRQHAGMIEEGLVYIDHQRSAAGGRLDVLMVDSGKSLIVAELKVVQDDGMLLQGLDYYDYAAGHIESYARLYKPYGINPTEQLRLLLIAPSFSQALVNRCKWLNVPISLFTFSCVKFQEEEDVVVIFSEREVTGPVRPIEISRLEDHLTYITDMDVRATVAALLDETKNWKPGNISMDAIKGAISMKVHGRVFAYLYPRRQHFIITTFDTEDEWTDYPVKSADELTNAKTVMRASMDARAK